MFDGPYPRKLTSEEKDILFNLLPQNKPGYRIYRELINSYFIIGEGNSGNSYILAKDISYINDIPFITHVFAAGIVSYHNKILDVAIQEELEDTIELSIDTREKQEGEKIFNYSEWIPGMKSPGDGSAVREVNIQNNNYILAILPVHKKIWLYDNHTGVNHFLSPGAFYNSLCIARNIREPGTVFNISLLFSEINIFSNAELIKAFHLYNKSLNRFRIEVPAINKVEKKKSFIKNIFKKDKN